MASNSLLMPALPITSRVVLFSQLVNGITANPSDLAWFGIQDETIFTILLDLSQRVEHRSSM